MSSHSRGDGVSQFEQRLARRRTITNKAFVAVCLSATALSCIVLTVLLVAIAIQGWKHLDANFLTNFASRFPDKSGVKAALWGSVWICSICALFALPIGLGTAIFLEEYKPRGRAMRSVHSLVQLNITNLAGVPSVVYGIIGLTAFARMFGMFGSPNVPSHEVGSRDSIFYFHLPLGSGVLAAGLTLALVVLPIVIISSREALRAVPDSLREGALAAGATRWQMISRLVLPSASPGILTGAILAMSRAIGEAAPLLIVSGVVFIMSVPKNLMSNFTALPLQIYSWAGQPKEEFHRVAASGIIVLLGVLLVFNALAVVIRQRFQKSLQ